jgi:hypothetical protein
VSETVICQFRVKPGSEDAMVALLGPHRDVLRELELVTDAPFQTYIGEERGLDGKLIVEIFQWADAEAAGRAHVHPRVSAIWERMDPLCERRGGRPAMDFPHVQPLSVP